MRLSLLLLLELLAVAGYTQPWIISTNSANNISNNNYGNVGIGTMNPTEKLHVYGGTILVDGGAGPGTVAIKGNGDNYQYANLVLGNNSNSVYWLLSHRQDVTNAFQLYCFDGSNYRAHQTVLVNGNIGMGTSNPSAKLEIAGTGGGTVDFKVNGRLQTGDANNNGGIFLNAANNQFVGQYSGTAMGLYNTGWHMVVDNTGNVGIGTPSPKSKLEIGLSGTGGISLGAYNAPSTPGVIRFVGTTGADGTFNAGAITGVDNGAAGMAIINTTAGMGNSQDVAFYSHYSGYQSNQKMIIKADGNIGIGTTTPQSKLAVNGTITATKIKVIQSGPPGWPDYVFHPAYHLPSLKEIEEYIKQHQHLPEVASAKTVEKEGLDVGENEAMLLKKIEELTLYLIDMKKQLDNQQNEIIDLRKKLSSK